MGQEQKRGSAFYWGETPPAPAHREDGDEAAVHFRVVRIKRVNKYKVLGTAPACRMGGGGCDFC